jgi:hypothetical protein
VKQNILVQYQWDLSFFAFSPKNVGNIRQAVFYLIDWGFSYEALVTMPIEEFLDYSKILYKHKQDKHDAEANAAGGAQKNPDGKSIGQVNPGQFS